MFNDYKIVESTPYHLGLKINKEYKCVDSLAEVCNKEIVTNPKFEKVLKNFDKSIYYMIYLDAINMWKDNKITGIGLSNFEDECFNNKKYR